MMSSNIERFDNEQTRGMLFRWSLKRNPTPRERSYLLVKYGPKDGTIKNLFKEIDQNNMEHWSWGAWVKSDIRDWAVEMEEMGIFQDELKWPD